MIRCMQLYEGKDTTSRRGDALFFAFLVGCLACAIIAKSCNGADDKVSPIPTIPIKVHLIVTMDELKTVIATAPIEMNIVAHSQTEVRRLPRQRWRWRRWRRR
jgi:hypothetical protein